MHFELWLQWAQGSGGTQNAVQSRRGNSNGKDSIVRMSLSAAELIGVMHERIASLFSCTVPAPQRAIPQPNFVPVSCRMSRTYHKRGMLGSPSKVRSIPFTLSFVAHRGFLTYVATVVEVEVGDDGEIRIPRVDTALDAGLVVNPASYSNRISMTIPWLESTKCQPRRMSTLRKAPRRRREWESLVSHHSSQRFVTRSSPPQASVSAICRSRATACWDKIAERDSAGGSFHDSQ
jgi:hypothetical protein